MLKSNILRVKEFKARQREQRRKKIMTNESSKFNLINARIESQSEERGKMLIKQ